ncbi:hypothetical protein [Mucilaginibacter mali]|nr:hypothetical protein [Mucilaginibacter mali]
MASVAWLSPISRGIGMSTFKLGIATSLSFLAMPMWWFIQNK